ncbi:hypothetical protein [uncultured Secundilactobacillus sp.]|uniref:hypothetical protein n=1 Tax=uncultured Secundilactobacillus sp. TaxID=2813935 RepID=UPI00258C7707|nr:hypothetical protein [uncultured Secundilactobacillus sp.]
MKVYNYKGLIAGVGMSGLGLVNLYFQLTGPIQTGSLLVKSWGIIIGCLLAGGVMIKRALSRNATREDKINERDERAKLVKLKANDLTLKILVGAIAFGALIYAILTNGSTTQQVRDVLGGIGLTIGLTFWIWLGSTIYYEHKL